MADIKKLIQQKREIERQIESERKNALKTLQKEVQQRCDELGFTPEEVLEGLKSRTRTRTSGATPKYFCNGEPVDGRAARRMPEFDEVKINGKIDDQKAHKAGMLNPAWINEAPRRKKMFP